MNHKCEKSVNKKNKPAEIMDAKNKQGNLMDMTNKHNMDDVDETSDQISKVSSHSHGSLNGGNSSRIYNLVVIMLMLTACGSVVFFGYMLYHVIVKM